MKVVNDTPFGKFTFWYFKSPRGARPWRPFNPPYKVYGPLMGGHYGVTEVEDCGNVLQYKNYTGCCSKETALAIVRIWNG